MLELPADLRGPGNTIVIDTVGRAYIANHTLTAHCWCEPPGRPRSRVIDLVDIIERRGHAWPLARVTARCTGCGRRATIVHGHVQWNVNGAQMPYPEPPGPTRSREAWEADYRLYRANRAENEKRAPAAPEGTAGAENRR